MNRARHIDTPLRGFVRLVWRQPLWAAAFAVFFGTLFGARLQDYVRSYQYSLVFAYAIGLVLWVTRHFIVPRLPVPPGCEGPRGFSITLAYSGMAFAGSYAAAIAIHLTFGRGFLGNAQQILTTGLFSLLFITMFSGIRYAMEYHRIALERARAVEQARADLVQAELRALRAQIHPHFLFNTLNAIASLIPVNPAAAEDVTTRLAELFRYALQASEREHIALASELAFLRDYLAVERVRFGDRLRVEEDIEPGLESLPVPTLLLQPLVENAVQYAVAPRIEGGRVRIGARREGDRLVLEVADDGPGLNGAPQPQGTGFGLHAVRERLRAAGLAEALHIDSRPGRGVTIRITLPIESPRGVS